MPGWVNRTALGDITGFDFSALNEDSLYRNMDKLYTQREFIERALQEKEASLFNLDDTIYCSVPNASLHLVFTPSFPRKRESRAKMDSPVEPGNDR